MKYVITIAFMLVCAALSAQDTTCVMITLDEMIIFDYQTSEVIDRGPVGYDVVLNVGEDEVMCIHLSDGKKRFRDVVTTYSDGEHTHHTFKSKNDVYYSPCCQGNLVIEIGQPKRRKNK